MRPRKSLSRDFARELCLCLVLVAGLGGCADYLDHRDGVTLSAGDAQAWNKTVQVADPWPRYVMNTRIPGDGQRTAGVIQRYSTGNTGAGAEQSSDAARDAAAGPGR
jgi:hypothetical protein